MTSPFLSSFADTMVKSRKKAAAVSYQLIPNYDSNGISTQYGGRTGATASAAAANGAIGFTSSNQNNLSSSTTKRPIFHHLTRLQHGIIRYQNVAESPTSVVIQDNKLSEKDRKFVYVPAGYSVQNDKCLPEILSSLHLKGLPPLLVVTAATDGAVEETIEEIGQVNIVDGSPNDGKSQLRNILSMDNNNLEAEELDLTEEGERELLREKTHEILRSTIELCAEIGAWVLPHRPRRVNGAAEILCGAIPDCSISSTKAPVILGLIGLDQQDAKDGFTELILSHIHPVGSEISNVAEVSYDPNVMDNTPCPELTHLLIFESRTEMRTFRERLLSKIPDVFLAFGKTTSYAKKSLFSSLVNRSPAALITHTSNEIDHMSLLLKHVDHETRKIDVGVIQSPATSSASHAMGASSDPVTYTALPMPPLPELEACDEELTQFLSKWPASHADERMVLADPRRVGGAAFRQKLLRAIDAAYYLEEARKVAMQDAIELLHVVEESSHQRNRITEQFHLKMVLATLGAVVTAVLYAKIYGEVPPPSLKNHDPYQIAMFLSTMLLPLLIAFFKKAYDKSSRSWSSIQGDKAKLQSALYEFRTRPRSYGQSTSSMQREPLEAFAQYVSDIRAKVLSEMKYMELSESLADGSGSKSITSTEEFDVEAPPPSEASPLLPPSIDAVSDPAIAAVKWKKRVLITCHNGQALSMEPEEGATSSSNSDNAMLSIKDYIESRIHVERDRKTGELETLVKRNDIMDTIIKGVLASVTLLALLSKQWFIPIVLGISAAFVASQDFRKYNKRVEQSEIMIAQLGELLKWWDQLDVEHKISSANEDRLVHTAESIIMADVSYTY